MILEAAASAAQYTDETRAAIKTTLEDNIAVLLAGDAGEAVTNIHVGTRRKDALYPSVYIAHIGTDDDDHELGSVRELRQRFRLYVYHRGGKNDGTLEAEVADLADRIKEVLHNNRDRQGDGLWYWLLCGRMVTGPAPSDKAATKIWAAHIDVLVLRSVS
ncbi:MAG: hypothetical protein GY937_22860 [bacterium]|nr:hypothetical protein [bacterium]